MQPLKASRTGPLFSAFPYPTKISPEAIALFIASHTKPGDTVFDGFAGSGTTGVAALLCAEPTPQMIAEAKKLRLRVQWGARRAVLREIGSLGAFVADTLCNPPDPEIFAREAERILVECERELAWVYEARDPDNRIGSLRYIVWSEVVRCPNCGKSESLWGGCVRRSPARINSLFTCPTCDRKTACADLQRVTKTYVDELTKEKVKARVRRPAWIYGSTGKKDWSRPVQASDRVLLARIGAEPLPKYVPISKIQWGDLYRSGYHQGITHLHHFYTRRNLSVFSSLWNRTESSTMRDALRFWLLSYNASHGTMMTRVVAKKGQRDLVVTSSQSGVLYISGLPVEKNLFAGLRRKIRTISAAFATTRRTPNLVDVQQGSCLKTDLADGTVDYVFTDPPFGGNIPYAEVNSINEIWLGRLTDTTGEVTISHSQHKDNSDYEKMMATAFRELHRILRSDGNATVVFHSSSSTVWNAFRSAYVSAGFNVENASILDKTQGSFKQVTTTGAVKGDLVLLMTKKPSTVKHLTQAVTPVMDELIKHAHRSKDGAENTPQRLYARFVTHYLARAQQVPLDADEFYRLVAARSTLQNASPSHQ
jgi:16S rRNA G966 N2-methylase RsmD